MFLEQALFIELKQDLPAPEVQRNAISNEEAIELKENRKTINDANNQMNSLKLEESSSIVDLKI